MLACPQVAAKTVWATGGAFTDTVVVLVSRRAKPSESPPTLKLVASVTMNEARPVRTVRSPFTSPTQAPMSSAAAIMSQMFMPNIFDPMATMIDEAPTTAPTERSNSPATMRTPIGIAMMPSSAAVSSQPAVPSIETKPAPRVDMAKKM